MGGTAMHGGAAGTLGGSGANSGSGAGGGASGGGAASDSGANPNGGTAGAVTPDAGSDTGGGNAGCPSSAVLRPGDSTASVQVGGVNRTFIVHVPSSYSGQTAVPLVLDFHPLFGTGAGQQRGSGYASLADQEGFIALFPNGIDNAWNVGPCCTTSRTVDDVGFAKAMVNKLKVDACIDARRVYAVGFSMGGGMSHFLACKAADVFAAVAPAAFDLLGENEAACQPARPITQISFRGTSDSIVPYAGGPSRPPNGLPITINFLGAEGTFQKWATLNGCSGGATDSGNGCRTFAQCRAGTEVTLCTKQGGGHETGNARLAWETLKRHALP